MENSIIESKRILQNASKNNKLVIFVGAGVSANSGIPMWSASIKNVQIDRAITDFHLNEVNNNFMGSKMISFNNGTPDDEMKTEIEI